MRKFETKQGRQARLKRQRRSNILAMAAAIVVVLVLSIVVFTGKRSLDAKGREYNSREELSQQIAEEESRSQSLEEYKKYVKTKKFVEEIAKNKFGLLYPDEIIFRSEGSGR